ncbi:MAG: lipoyl(octanoyl) transferase LipB [Candidatus Neomarinimicrobiota bacterium]|nr:lipoyl(octanoyl) transferase LipB [Candidatus Neomarinimicrobiota bacterium]
MSAHIQTESQSVELDRTLDVLQLGRRDYGSVWELQKELVEERHLAFIPDTLILLEHDPVYTLGKNSDENHLLDSRDGEVPVYQIERGGDVTFHGPGQLVAYPILDLHQHRLSVSWYIHSLEEVLIKTLARFAIDGRRRDGLTGVWVGEEKIGALGVRLSRWISMHGVALNVNTDLRFYDGIIPCGIFEYDVTSMANLLGHEVEMGEVMSIFTAVFREKFAFYSSEMTNA